MKHVATYNSQAILKFSISSKLLQESTVNHTTLKAKYISQAKTHGYADLQNDQVQSVSLQSMTCHQIQSAHDTAFLLAAKPDSQTCHD